MRSEASGESPEQPDEMARLPRGRHGLSAEFVAENQRERLIVSLVQVVAEHGYNETTITRIIERAGVTTRTFYKYFDSVEACYLAAFDAAVDLLGARLAEAWEAEEEWPAKVRAAIASLLEFFSSAPELGRFCLVEPFVAGPATSRRYQEALEQLSPYLREGREQGGKDGALPETTERGLLGSVGSQIGRKLSSEDPEQLPQQLADLVQFTLTPYLGTAEARRVALQAT